jgi:hypothetical protein
MKKTAIILAGLLAFGLTACTDSGHTMNGTLTVIDIDTLGTGDPCGGGYDVEHAAVEVRDQGDHLIGAATTGTNVSTDDLLCTVHFTVDQLPEVKFYQITIGSHGGPAYSLEELEKMNWKVDLSLGS